MDQFHQFLDVVLRFQPWEEHLPKLQQLAGPVGFPQQLEFGMGEVRLSEVLFFDNVDQAS